MKIKFKKLSLTAIIPERATSGSAGYDLYADISHIITIPPSCTVKIPTGIAIALPENTFGGIFPRSGIATKRGLAPANKVGVVDSDYRGECMVALHNHSNEMQIVEIGEKIAQLIIIPYIAIELEEVDDLNTTARGSGGFGSTDK